MRFNSNFIFYNNNLYNIERIKSLFFFISFCLYLRGDRFNTTSHFAYHLYHHYNKLMLIINNKKIFKVKQKKKKSFLVKRMFTYTWETVTWVEEFSQQNWDFETFIMNFSLVLLLLIRQIWIFVCLLSHTKRSDTSYRFWFYVARNLQWN